MFEVFKNNFLLFWFIFFIFALTLIEGQYSSGLNQCDHNRLQRCQQDITTNIQEPSNAQTGGYTGISSGYQSSQTSDTHTRCSAIRQNLDCLLMHTPPCQLNRTNTYDARTGTGTYDSSYRNNPGDFIRRGKQTIERFCEQGGGGWKSASCYTRQDVRNCENQFGYSSNPPPMSSSACRNYQDYRDCVVRIVRQSCYPQDLQLMATYLIDKAGEISWNCPINSDYSGYNPSRMDGNYNDPYRPSSGTGSGYGNTNFDNRNDPNRNTYDSSRYPYDQNRPQTGYDSTRYGNQYDSNRGSGGFDRDRYGSGGQYAGSQQYPGSQNQPIDRFGGSGYYPTTDSCLERSGYFVRTCEDTLIQRQRDAREGRSSTDVQRRICCALFFYRDCISRVVVDRCRDPSPTVVDILMGSRKRDLTVTCREYSRDQCSASSLIKSSFSLFLSVLVSMFMLKSRIF